MAKKRKGDEWDDTSADEETNNKRSRPQAEREDDSSDEEELPLKAAKGGKLRRISSSASKSQDDEADHSEDGTKIDVLTTPEGDKYIDLSQKRRVTVRAFKGRPLIDIREFYGNAGDEKPGKKGISLTLEQWDQLKKSVATIDGLITKVSKTK